MRKLQSVVLVVLVAVLLTACGRTSNEKAKETTVGDNSTPVIQQSTQVEESTVAESQALETVLAENPAKSEPTINETVLIDEAGVKITAKGLEMEGWLGPEIKLLIENTSGKDLTVQSRNTSVNGYMVDDSMSVEVVNGKKANGSLSISESSLKACGIETIADIECAFHVFESASWDEYLDTDTVQLHTSIAPGFQQPYDDSGNLVYEGNGTRIIVKGLEKDESLDYTNVIVYIENNRDKGITVQTRDESVNGFMIDPIFSCEIGSGKKAVDTISFRSSELMENGITTVENIELLFHVYETDGWEEIVDTDVIHLSF